MISSFEKKFFEVVDLSYQWFDMSEFQNFKISNVPCVQAIYMTRHCKLYSGEIIEFHSVSLSFSVRVDYLIIYLLCRILGGG